MWPPARPRRGSPSYSGPFFLFSGKKFLFRLFPSLSVSFRLFRAVSEAFSLARYFFDLATPDRLFFSQKIDQEGVKTPRRRHKTPGKRDPDKLPPGWINADNAHRRTHARADASQGPQTITPAQLRGKRPGGRHRGPQTATERQAQQGGQICRHNSRRRRTRSHSDRAAA